MSHAPSSQAVSNVSVSAQDARELSRRVSWAKALLRKGLTEVEKDIEDQRQVLEHIMTAIVANGHVLAESVPGLGKTKTMKSFSIATGLQMSRIQFTPDLQPIDLTGSEIKNKHTDEWEFIPGPLVGNLVLADEINRAGQKTQAATLEVMEERQITVGGVTRKQPRPFNLMATQNPVDQDGTMPLPEAQSDRFLMKVKFDYVSADAEEKFALRESSTTVDLDLMEKQMKAYEENSQLTDCDISQQEDKNRKLNAQQAFTKQNLIFMQHVAMSLPISNDVSKMVKSLVRILRPTDDNTHSFIRENVALGPSPRAQISFLHAAKARVLVSGYDGNEGPQLSPTMNDVAALVSPILEHRIMMKPGSKKTAADVLKYACEQMKLTV